jgi:hypothetical protein
MLSKGLKSGKSIFSPQMKERKKPLKAKSVVGLLVLLTEISDY